MIPSATGQAQGRGPNFPTLRNSSHVGVGYVANIPNTFVGFSAVGLTPKLLGGAGLYVDVKLATNSPGSDPYYLPNVSIQEAEVTFGDLLFEEESDWFSVNAALVYAIAPEFAVYGGAGYSKEERYRQYFDDSQTRGDLGFYWVADPDGSGNRINLLGGAFFRLARFVMFQFGVEAKPVGVTAGAIFVYPF
jgi:hypothetical protein